MEKQKNNNEGEHFTEKEVKKSKTWRNRGRAALLSFLMMTGIAGASANENTNSANDKALENQNSTEQESQTQSPDNIEPDPEKDYVFGSENDQSFEFEEKTDSNVEITEQGSVIDMKQYFEVDKADISPESAEQIKSDFSEFLSSINADNYEDVMAQEWTIFGSSDERPTDSWEDGNKGLTDARLKALGKLLAGELSSHSFEGQGLSPTQVSELLQKQIGIDMPEDGVTYVTDLTNPETGKNYTEAEVQEMIKNGTVGEKYAEARRTEFRSEIPEDQLDDFEMEPSSGELIVEFESVSDPEFLKTIFEHDGAKKILVDISGSFSWDDFTAGLKSLVTQYNIDVRGLEITPFDHELHMEWSTTIMSAQDLDELPDKMITYKGSDIEYGVDALADRVEKMSDNMADKDNAINIMTDEAVQGVTLDKLEAALEASQEKGTTSKINFVNSETGGVMQMELSKILEVLKSMPELEDIKGPLALGIGSDQLEGRSAAAHYVDLREAVARYQADASGPLTAQNL